MDRISSVHYVAMGNAPSMMIDPNGESFDRAPMLSERSAGENPYTEMIADINSAFDRLNGGGIRGAWGNSIITDLTRGAGSGGGGDWDFSGLVASMGGVQIMTSLNLAMNGDCVKYSFSVPLGSAGGGGNAEEPSYGFVGPVQPGDDSNNGDNPDPQSGSSTTEGQIWYYMYRVNGGAHAMAHDPKNNVVYDINSWRDENNKEIPTYKRFLKHPTEPLSVAYQYHRDNLDNSWDMLSEREAGKKWALCPIYVPNPAAATAWFQSHTGKGWEYSAGFNNCSIYVMEGLAAGGAKIYHVGVNPAPSSVNSKPTIYWYFPEKP